MLTRGRWAISGSGSRTCRACHSGHQGIRRPSGKQSESPRAARMARPTRDIRSRTASFPTPHQPGADGIFLHVDPFRFGRFIPAQQLVENTVLPFQGCLCFAPHKALQPGRVLRDLRIAVSYWPNERVPVIRHDNRRDGFPLFTQITNLEDRDKDLRIIQDRPTAADTKW